jgi:hypothetical protein
MNRVQKLSSSVCSISQIKLWIEVGTFRETIFYVTGIKYSCLVHALTVCKECGDKAPYIKTNNGFNIPAALFTQIGCRLGRKRTVMDVTAKRKV